MEGSVGYLCKLESCIGEVGRPDARAPPTAWHARAVKHTPVNPILNSDEENFEPPDSMAIGDVSRSCGLFK